jgi:hypothetical protein
MTAWKETPAFGSAGARKWMHCDWPGSPGRYHGSAERRQQYKRARAGLLERRRTIGSSNRASYVDSAAPNEWIAICCAGSVLSPGPAGKIALPLRPLRLSITLQPPHSLNFSHFDSPRVFSAHPWTCIGIGTMNVSRHLARVGSLVCCLQSPPTLPPPSHVCHVGTAELTCYRPPDCDAADERWLPSPIARSTKRLR